MVYFESFLVVFLVLSRDFTIQAVYVARKAAEGYAGQEIELRQTRERPAKDPRKTRERPAKKNTKKICIFENKVVSL